MNEYVHPIGEDGVNEVADWLARTAAEEVVKWGRQFTEDMPFVNEPGPREQLDFYRRTQLPYWEQLAANDADEAMYHLIRWGELLGRYGPAPTMPPPPPYTNGNGGMPAQAAERNGHATGR